MTRTEKYIYRLGLKINEKDVDKVENRKQGGHATDPITVTVKEFIRLILQNMVKIRECLHAVLLVIK